LNLAPWFFKRSDPLIPFRDDRQATGPTKRPDRFQARPRRRQCRQSRRRHAQGSAPARQATGSDRWTATSPYR